MTVLPNGRDAAANAIKGCGPQPSDLCRILEHSPRGIINVQNNNKLSTKAPEKTISHRFIFARLFNGNKCFGYFSHLLSRFFSLCTSILQSYFFPLYFPLYCIVFNITKNGGGVLLVIRIPSFPWVLCVDGNLVTVVYSEIFSVLPAE